MDLLSEMVFGGVAVVVAVGMWESRERFPRAVGNKGNPVLVFLVFQGPSFPQRFG